MRDIKGIKEKINEITLLTESEHNPTAISLFNMIKNGEGMQEVYDEFGGDNYEGDLLDRCDEYVENEEQYGLDKPYQDINWVRVGDKYFNWEEIWADWNDYCQYMDKPKSPDDEGKEWLDETSNPSEYFQGQYNKAITQKYKEIDANYNFLMTENCPDREKWENFITDIEQFLDMISSHGLEEVSVLNDILDDAQDIALYNTNWNWVNDETGGEYENLEEFVGDSVAPVLMYYMNDRGRAALAESAYKHLTEYLNEHPNLIRYDESNPEKPEDTGKEWLDESVLMEMPATNYTSFHIQPYIICDAEYFGDEDNPNDDPFNWACPFADLVDTHAHLPSWLTDEFSRRDEPLPIPELNKKLNTDFVCIVGIPGYYDGMTVGIVERDYISWDFLTDYFEETGYEDEEGGQLFKPKLQFSARDDRRYTEDEATEYIANNLIKPEIEKAKDIIIEAQSIYGGRLYPRDMEYKAPTQSGEEFNESVNLTETVQSPKDLPNPSWYDAQMEPGDNFSDEYEGYVVFIECNRDDDNEDDWWYNIQIFDAEDEDEDALEEAAFSYWNDMVNYLKNYVYHHPARRYNPNIDEPNEINIPKQSGEDWVDESLDLHNIKKQINEIVRKADGNN